MPRLPSDRIHHVCPIPRNRWMADCLTSLQRWLPVPTLLHAWYSVLNRWKKAADFFSLGYPKLHGR